MIPQLLNHAFVAQASEIDSSGLTLQPPAPHWLPHWAWYVGLALCLVLAVAAATYLYRAQQRIASKRIIVTLTTIRSLLILMMFVALLGAGYQFTHTGKSDGTLWLMLDQSASMAQNDPQGTPLERLRWADALHYLPADARASGLGRQAAKLTVLREDLGRLQAMTAAPVEEKDAKRKVSELVQGLRKWKEQVASVADAVEKDAQGKSDAKTIQALRSAVTKVAAGADKADGKAKPEEAAGDVPWREVQAALDPAATALREAADKADTALASNPRVQDALTKVSKQTRAQLAAAVLTAKMGDKKKDENAPAGFEQLIPRQRLKVLAFGEQSLVVQPAAAGDGPRKAIDDTLAKPVAPATDVGGGLRLIGDQVGQSEPASVVLFSDGRDNKREGDLAEAARRLSARGIRVYTVALGSQEVAPDAAVENIDAPDWVFKGDTIKLSALLRVDGLYKRDDAGRYQGPKKTVTVELHRSQMVNGKPQDTLIDTKEVDVDVPPQGAPNQVRTVVSFAEKKDQLPDPGLYDYRVEIKEVEDEAVKTNNSQAVRVSVKDDKLAVLMIEDQPRWEFRYVANYLSRDNRVKLQTVLFQAARIEKVTPPNPVKASPDNEKTEAQVLPETQEEWYKFGLIFLGDLPPEYLPRKQQEMIVKAVTERGATLIVTAGPLNMPGNWGSNKTENPLSVLFPVEQSPDWTPQAMQAHLKQGYHPQIAPEGHNHLLTQFGIDDAANDRAWAMIRTDPDLAWYWHSELTQARGGAQVLWSIADAQPRTAERRPADNAATPSQDPTAFEQAGRRALLATMNVGLGKVMYLAGDATWRLRQVNGQNLHERFWGQVIRWVVGNDLPAGGQFVKFGSDKPRYVDGESAIVTARITDKHLAPLKGQKVKVIARQVGGTGKRVEAEMQESPEAAGQYRAVLSDLPSGQVELSLAGGDVEQLLNDDKTVTQKTLAIEVMKGLNLEQKNINADRATLGMLAQAGGGAMVEGYYADVLAEHIPELNYQVTSAQQIGLFADPNDPWTRNSHYIFLGLFVALAAAEWIVRKAGGLV